MINSIVIAYSILPKVRIALESTVPILNLSNGTPNPDTFPFQNISVTMKDGISFSIEGEQLTTAMQYTQSEGIPELITLLKDYQARLHSPPIKGQWTVALTAGGQDCLSKACEILINPGESIICEEYFYPGVISFLKPYNVKHIKVKGDQDGMRPDSLREALKKWTPEEARNKTNGAPKVLYLVPNGGNPVGTSTTAKRRQEIYKIAQEYDLIIFEDDPYYFLQYSTERAPSFLSMDVDGRVLRFDAFSKIFSPGIRLGYVTGSQALVQKIVLTMQSTQLHSCVLSQVITHEILQQMGFNGFLNYAKTVSAFYERQRDLMLAYAKKWLSGLAQWHTPQCGIFLWARVLGMKDTHQLVMNALPNKHISVLPGGTCTMTGEPSPYIRVCYSTATEAEMDEGISRLADAIHEELQAQNNKTQSNIIYN